MSDFDPENLPLIYSFGREHLLGHHLVLQRVVFLSLLSQHLEVQEKAARIAHHIILSLVSIYPTELSCWDIGATESDREKYLLRFYKHIGDFDETKFRVSWHETSEAERKYAEQWTNQTLYRVIDFFEEKYFKTVNLNIDVTRDLHRIIDDINLKAPQQSGTLKSDVLISVTLLEEVFSAINIRCGQIYHGTSNQTYISFRDNFLFVEYQKVHSRILDFIKKLFVFILNKDLTNDVAIMKIILKLMASLIGEDD